MISYWLNKVLGSDETENLGKLVPLIIFFVIWVVGAIAKAAQKGKGDTETESSQVDKELADKIRERYAQKKAGREVQQRENEQFSPPARVSKPKSPPPRRPEPRPPKKPIAPPVYSQEGPTLRVVKGLEKPDVGTPLPVYKPTLQKVESGLQKVDALTPENAKASSEPEIIHHHYISELAEQYSTADGFRKAILNYEILGPPVALRCAVETQSENF
ncbi:MAG: hypothetical protein ABSB11_04510 [Sedimentisphaerales bacterium]|jgi:cytoskeletal protein RodZ